MKKKLSTIILIWALIMSLGLFAACGGNDYNNGNGGIVSDAAEDGIFHLTYAGMESYFGAHEALLGEQLDWRGEADYEGWRGRMPAIIQGNVITLNSAFGTTKDFQFSRSGNEYIWRNTELPQEGSYWVSFTLSGGILNVFWARTGLLRASEVTVYPMQFERV